MGTKVEMAGSPYDVTSNEDFLASFDAYLILAEGESIESVEAAAYEHPGMVNVSAQILSGSPAHTDIICYQRLHSFTAGKTYRVEILITTSDDNKREGFVLFRCVV